MAQANEITVKIGVDGEAAIISAERISKGFNNMQAASKGLAMGVKDLGLTFDQLSKQEGALAQERDKQTKRLADLRKQYEELDKSSEDTGAAQYKLSQQMKTVENAIEKIDKQMADNHTQKYIGGLKEIDDALEAVTTQMELHEAESKQLGQTQESLARSQDLLNQKNDLSKQKMQLLGNALQKAKTENGETSATVKTLASSYNIVAEANDKATAAAGEYKNALNGVNHEAEKASAAAGSITDGVVGAEVTFNRAGDALTNSVTKPLIEFGKGAMQAALDAEAMESAFDQAFGKSAAKSRDWSKQFSESMQVNQYALRDMMFTQKTMFEGMDLPIAKHDEMIEGMMGRVYDMAAMYNIDVAEAFQKFQSGLTGSSMGLQRIGVVVKEADVKTYAYAHSIAEQGKELTEQQKVMARYGSIMEKTSTSQGQWTNELDTGAGAQKAFREQMDELEAKIGEALIPAFNRIMDAIKPIIDAFLNMDDNTRNLAVGIGLVGLAIGPVLKLIGSMKQMQIAGGLKGIGGAASSLGGVLGGTLLPKLLAIGAAIAAIAAVAASVKWLFGQFWDMGTDSQKNNLMSQLSDLAQKLDPSTKRLDESFQFGKNARGTSNWRGGFTWVGEDGPEVVDLPRGSRIHPANESSRMGGGNTYHLHVNADEINEVQKLLATVRDLERRERQR